VANISEVFAKMLLSSNLTGQHFRTACFSHLNTLANILELLTKMRFVCLLNTLAKILELLAKTWSATSFLILPT
jgi:hypothetical protein